MTYQRLLQEKMKSVLKEFPTEALILELARRSKMLRRINCPWCERLIDIDKPLLLLEVD